ncbi:MAG: ABC transporter substrate-binding protein [Oscillospiraceae bacterium]
MKNVWKKVAAVCVAAAMAVPFTGCSSSNGSADGNAEGGVLKIGGIGPVTGGAALYGIAVKNAAELAVKEINENGGINGMQVEFKFEDDVHDAEKSVNAYNSLKDWGMQILMGTVTSTPCQAVVEESHNDNMFQLTPSGSAVESIKYDNAFRVCFSDPNQGIASAQYIGSNGIASKVAVIYNSSDVYSTGIYEKFAEEAENQPFEIVAAEAFTDDSKSDFSVQITKAKDAGAELVFLPIYFQEASLILQQANSLGFAPKYFGCDGLDGLLDVENFDISLSEGVMLLTPFAADATDDATVSFVNAYTAAYGDTPIQFAADAYDAMYIIKAAAEKANITANMSVSEMGDALKAAMTEITVDGLTGSGITWDAAGEPTKEPKAVKIVITEAEDGTKTGAYAAM